MKQRNAKFVFVCLDEDDMYSNDSNSPTYRGPYPFSESETEAVRDFVLSRKNDDTGEQTLKAFFSAHSFANAIFYPYNDKPGHYPDDKDDLVWYYFLTRNDTVLPSSFETKPCSFLHPGSVAYLRP